MNLFEQFRAGTEHVLAKLDDAADVLEHWALIKAHIRMYEYLEQGSTIEIKKVPELARNFASHTLRNLDKHINLAEGRIFNPDIAGDYDDLEDWQRAGYPINRTDDNYARRRMIFKAIYNETPLIKKKERKDGTFNIRSINLNRKYNVTYRSIVKARLFRYRRRVPFWLTLNYGTDYYAREGYPVVGGIFFLEKAESHVVEYRRQALDYLDTLAAAAIFQEPIAGVPEGIDRTPGWTIVSATNTKSQLLAYAQSYMLEGSQRLYNELTSGY